MTVSYRKSGMKLPVEWNEKTMNIFACIRQLEVQVRLATKSVLISV